MLCPDLSSRKRRNSGGASALQRGLLHGQGVVFPHHQNKVFPGLRQSQDPVIPPPGLRRGGICLEVVGVKGGVGRVCVWIPPSFCKISIDGVPLPVDDQQSEDDHTTEHHLPGRPPRKPEGNGCQCNHRPSPMADSEAMLGANRFAQCSAGGGKCFLIICGAASKFHNTLPCHRGGVFQNDEHHHSR